MNESVDTGGAGQPLRFPAGVSSDTRSWTQSEQADELPAQTIRWLGVPWRPAHKLSAARVSLSAGRHQCIWPSTWDGLVLGGRGALGTPDGTDTPLTAGHAITWDGSAHGALEVVDRLDLLIVVPPEHPGGSDRPETHPFSSGTGTRYMLPNAVAGGPSSEVTWHRDGPEGTGAFFSGRWRSGAIVYDKEFIADEFVLVEHGSIQIWNAQLAPITFGEGDIAFFPKGLFCRRQVSDGFEQWFAGQ